MKLSLLYSLFLASTYFASAQTVTTLAVAGCASPAHSRCSGRGRNVVFTSHHSPTAACEAHCEWKLIFRFKVQRFKVQGEKPQVENAPAL